MNPVPSAVLESQARRLHRISGVLSPEFAQVSIPYPLGFSLFEPARLFAALLGKLDQRLLATLDSLMIG
jgi:hypothetical protein